MEDVGTQVASPVIIHQTLPQRFCNTHPIVKKRTVPFYSSSFHYKNPSDNWDPKSWDWDSSRFVARPLQCDGDQVTGGSHVSSDLPRSKEANKSASTPAEDQIKKDAENLRLMLGGGEQQAASNMNLMEEPHPVSRPSKRVRSGSPGNSNRPMCQVDDCKEDLSAAKDYHRRHKVCEVHSKASKALVGNQMQRFCQQCSRFHPLSEFDDGKRSCRRRLAGHNRRRRKTQPEDATPQVSVPSAVHNDINCDVDVINLLAALARPQGNPEDKNAKSSSIPDKDHLVQILSKINSLPLPAILASKLPHLKTTSGSVSDHGHSENQEQMSANASSPSTMDLLAGLSGNSGVPSEALEVQWQLSTKRSKSEKSKTLYVDDAARPDFQKGSVEFPSVGGERSSTSCQHSPMEEVECHAPETSPSLHLQLFSSSSEDSRKLSLNANYLSSNSSNISHEISPTSSPPLVHNLFPMRTSGEKMDSHLSNIEDEARGEPSMSNGCSTSLCLFGGSFQPVEHGSIQSSPCQAGYTSSSGSDHSPSSLNSDAQDRTGRIIFKLFDKDPSHLPGSLRSQIFNWLSNSPSEMESYIRPGCIVIQLYLSMPIYTWDRLEENFFDCVSSLVKGIDASFWGSGRFLVCTDRQMASHKDGKIRLCKTWRGLATPELLSVSPVAVVAGQETSLMLRGRSLTAPGTKVHCTHADGYDITEVQASMRGDTALDEINVGGFKISGRGSNSLGRCFIEVENSIRGTTFPVIIADKPICHELRLLEPQINAIAEVGNDIPNDHIQSTGRSWSREVVLHFLDELGWLFQRKRNSTLFGAPDYRLSRFKFLLTFAIEHDFCALVKTLLDILLELNLGRKGLVTKSMSMLSEIHPLNRAVRRKCQGMIEMLVHYSVIDPDDGSERYIFVPNLAGPGGLTPLHLAACATSSDGIVAALISDPQEVGLHSWNSALDANGLSPHAYALMRKNHSYNDLVARKLAERKKGEVCVSIENIETNSFTPLEVGDEKRKKTTTTTMPCSMCAVAAAHAHRKFFPGSQGLLQRPYIHSMLLVAAVCVCVCVFLRGRPYVGCIAPFAWENLNYGAS